MGTQKKIKTSLYLLFLLCFSLNTQAQFWKKIAKKVQDKTEDRALNEVDKQTDKTLDGILEKKAKKKKKTKLQKTYTFNGSVTVEVSNETDEKAEFDILFNKNSEVFCMTMSVDEANQIYNVITPTQAIAFLDVGGMKIKKQVDDLDFDNTDKMPNEDGEFSKTGKIKSVLGYKCSEYMYKNEGGAVSVWVTKNFPIKSAYAPLLGMTKNSKINGFVLELNYKANSGERAMVKVIKIDKNKKKTINTTNYKSMF